jgi:hypothetical protein
MTLGLELLDCIEECLCSSGVHDAAVMVWVVERLSKGDVCLSRIDGEVTKSFVESTRVNGLARIHM